MMQTPTVTVLSVLLSVSASVSRFCRVHLLGHFHVGDVDKDVWPGNPALFSLVLQLL